METKTQLLELPEPAEDPPEIPDTVTFPDERLELVFTCCHPALATDAQVALTLRTLGGLTTEEIARAFLVAEATMAQRPVRAKRKVKAAGIPFRARGAPAGRGAGAAGRPGSLPVGRSREAYVRALDLFIEGAERRRLARRMTELSTTGDPTRARASIAQARPALRAGWTLAPAASGHGRARWVAAT